MVLYTCSKCEKGAVLVEDLKVPEGVTSIKVVSGKKVLSLYVSMAKADNTCPYCGMPIKTVILEKPVKKTEKKPEPTFRINR